MAPQHEPLGEALRPGGVDIILLELLDQRRAHHPGDDGGGTVPEGQRRKDEVPDGVDERRPAAGENGIDDVEVRRVSDALEDVGVTPPDGEPTERHPEDDQHEDGEPENNGMLAPLIEKIRVK